MAATVVRMLLLRVLLLVILWQSVCTLPLVYGEESTAKPGISFYQYAVLFSSTSQCNSCANSTNYTQWCEKQLHNFVYHDFPDHTVEIDRSSFLCNAENGRGVVLLRLRLCPPKDEQKGEGSSANIKLQRMLECSGHLSSSVHYFETCSYYTAQSEQTQPRTNVDADLIAVLVTVFVVAVMLLLVILTYWKRKKVMAFTKRHWAARCRRQDEDGEQPLQNTPPRSFGSTSSRSIDTEASHLTWAIDRIDRIANKLERSLGSQGEEES